MAALTNPEGVLASEATPLAARRERSRLAWSALRERSPVSYRPAFVLFFGIVALALIATWMRPAVDQGAVNVDASARCAITPGKATTLDFCTQVGLDIVRSRLAGISARNARLTLLKAAGADLAGADFSYADMSAADLAGARLRGARLVGAALAGADLRYADLRGADLRHADLEAAILTGARLDRARSDNAINPKGERCVAALSAAACLQSASNRPPQPAASGTPLE